MIQHFTEIHDQLKQLAPTINSFKSEAVQLRIVELIFSGGSEEETPAVQIESDSPPDRPIRKRRRQGTKEVSPQSATSVPKTTGKRSSGRPGPGAIVDALIGESYFKQPRGAADIVAHCRTDKVLSYNNTEITVALGRAVKAQKLKREKNADGQFRYSNR